MKLKRWIFAPIVTVSLGAIGQAPPPIGKIPTEEECLGYIAILPTFRSENMKPYSMIVDGKELVEKIQSLADGGDKDVQFTYSMLLLNGYCVPKDVCAARRYLEKSRGGPNNWEQVYPKQPWPAESMCK